MAESTRFRIVEDQLKQQAAGQARIQELLENLLLSHQNLDACIEATDNKIDEKIAAIEGKLLSFMKAMAQQEKLNPIEKSVPLPDRTPLLPTPNGKAKEDVESSLGTGDRWGRNGWYNGPKVELPMFQGNHPREWLRKCQRYFLIYQIPADQKLHVVEMHLEGRAEVWYQSIKLAKGQLTWEEFCIDLNRRFGEKGLMDEIEEFNKLQQHGSVREYQEKFEELRSEMLMMNPNLSEPYFISSFISGVKDEIKPMLRLMKPTTLLV